MSMMEQVVEPPRKLRHPLPTPSTGCPCCGAALSFEKPRIDNNTSTLLFRDLAVKLPAMERELARMLIARVPGIVSRDALITGLWGLNETGNIDKSVHVLVSRLRHTIRSMGLGVEAIHGAGYRMVVL